MNKRTIKKRLMRLDELALPAKEKMLPPEALVKKESPVIEKRKNFPRLAVASLAIVALAVATALVIGSIAGGNEKQIDPENNLVLNNSENTSTPSVLENEASDNKASTEYTSTEESEVSRKDMPIVSCGKYSPQADASEWCVFPGEVCIGTMRCAKLDIDELQADVLYAVCFSAEFLENTEYKEGIARIEKEAMEKHPLGFTDEDYREMYAEMDEFYYKMKENATAKMYEYLEGFDINFYEKKVYTYITAKEEICSEEVYRIAFLTKEEIELLKGGEDYGVLVKIVFDELAKQDNEPVYINTWTCLC